MGVLLPWVCVIFAPLICACVVYLFHKKKIKKLEVMAEEFRKHGFTTDNSMGKNTSKYTKNRMANNMQHSDGRVIKEDLKQEIYRHEGAIVDEKKSYDGKTYHDSIHKSDQVTKSRSKKLSRNLSKRERKKIKRARRKIKNKSVKLSYYRWHKRDLGERVTVTHSKTDGTISHAYTPVGKKSEDSDRIALLRRTDHIPEKNIRPSYVNKGRPRGLRVGKRN
jgi:hypothetical protein